MLLNVPYVIYRTNPPYSAFPKVIEIAYHSVMFCLLAICSIAAFAVGLLLVKDQRRVSGGKMSSQAKELIVLLICILAATVARFITAGIVWGQSLGLPADGGLSFPGLVYMLTFLSYGSACAFYLFVFLLPDAIPSIVTLVVLVRGVGRLSSQPQVVMAPEGYVPLLEGAMKRYEV